MGYSTHLTPPRALLPCLLCSPQRERAKKSIELDVCLSVWELVLAGPEFPLLKDFSEFLKGANVPVVTKDMWAQVRERRKNLARATRDRDTTNTEM